MTSRGIDMQSEVKVTRYELNVGALASVRQQAGGIDSIATVCPTLKQ